MVVLLLEQAPRLRAFERVEPARLGHRREIVRVQQVMHGRVLLDDLSEETVSPIRPL